MIALGPHDRYRSNTIWPLNRRTVSQLLLPKHILLAHPSSSRHQFVYPCLLCPCFLSRLARSLHLLAYSVTITATYTGKRDGPFACVLSCVLVQQRHTLMLLSAARALARGSEALSVKDTRSAHSPGPFPLDALLVRLVDVRFAILVLGWGCAGGGGSRGLRQLLYVCLFESGFCHGAPTGLMKPALCIPACLPFYDRLGPVCSWLFTF